jgi:hypothetical protein
MIDRRNPAGSGTVQTGHLELADSIGNAFD